jgi:hypothetical protein
MKFIPVNKKERGLFSHALKLSKIPTFKKNPQDFTADKRKKST